MSYRDTPPVLSQQPQQQQQQQRQQRQHQQQHLPSLHPFPSTTPAGLPSRPKSAATRDEVFDRRSSSDCDIKFNWSPSPTRPQKPHSFPPTLHTNRDAALVHPRERYRITEKAHCFPRPEGDVYPPYQEAPSPVSLTGSADIEKQLQHPLPAHPSQSSAQPAGELWDEKDEPASPRTLRSLLHLAFIAPPLSMALCIYSIIILILTTVVFPLRLCIKSQPSLPIRLASRLIPPLNLQRQGIFQHPVPDPRSKASPSSQTPLHPIQLNPSTESNTNSAPLLSAATLSYIHFFSPIVCLPIAICAWCMAIAWGLGALVSHERAGDDMEERRLADKIVRWWAWWLDWWPDPLLMEWLHCNAEEEERDRSRR